jgi:hypothetical protein
MFPTSLVLIPLSFLNVIFSLFSAYSVIDGLLKYNTYRSTRVLSLKFLLQHFMQMVIGLQHEQTPITSPAAPKVHFQEAKTIQLDRN